MSMNCWTFYRPQKKIRLKRIVSLFLASQTLALAIN